MILGPEYTYFTQTISLIPTKHRVVPLKHYFWKDKELIEIVDEKNNFMNYSGSSCPTLHKDKVNSSKHLNFDNPFLNH